MKRFSNPDRWRERGTSDPATDPAATAESGGHPPGGGLGRAFRSLRVAVDERLRWIAAFFLAILDDACRAAMAVVARVRDALGAGDVSVAPARLPRARRPWHGRRPHGWGDQG
jgi:hypothetical protein